MELLNFLRLAGIGSNTDPKHWLYPIQESNRMLSFCRPKSGNYPGTVDRELYAFIMSWQTNLCGAGPGVGPAARSHLAPEVNGAADWRRGHPAEPSHRRYR
jgi:hypothetical protein